MGSHEWAVEEFGSAALGDERRTRRCVSLATAAAKAPSGLISEVVAQGKTREAAYRFLENSAFDYTSMARAARSAAFRRGLAEAVLLAPVDGTSLTLESVPDDELGSVGNQWTGARGIQVMDCILLTEAGVPVGPGGVTFWTRETLPRLSRRKTHGQGKSAAKKEESVGRPIGTKETANWGEVMEQTLGSAQDIGFVGRIWFQLDAGADFGHLLASAPLIDSYVTVRSRNDRSLWDEAGLVIDHVLEQAAAGTYELKVPEGPKRLARTATMEVRCAPVVIKARLRGEPGVVPAPLYAVHTQEVSRVPRGEEPINWLLLTTYPTTSLADAQRVIHAYSKRWRVEELHKTWKSVAGIEEVALRSVDAIAKWGVILLSVAVRVERLKYLSRAQPETQPSDQFTSTELDVLRRYLPKKGPRTELKTLEDAVRVLASIGGYMNPAQKPPGSIVIARGLLRLAEESYAAEVVRTL